MFNFSTSNQGFPKWRLSDPRWSQSSGHFRLEAAHPLMHPETSITLTFRVNPKFIDLWIWICHIAANQTMRSISYTGDQVIQIWSTTVTSLADVKSAQNGLSSYFVQVCAAILVYIHICILYRYILSWTYAPKTVSSMIARKRVLDEPLFRDGRLCHVHRLHPSWWFPQGFRWVTILKYNLTMALVADEKSTEIPFIPMAQL